MSASAAIILIAITLLLVAYRGPQDIMPAPQTFRQKVTYAANMASSAICTGIVLSALLFGVFMLITA